MSVMHLFELCFKSLVVIIKAQILGPYFKHKKPRFLLYFHTMWVFLLTLVGHQWILLVLNYWLPHFPRAHGYLICSLVHLLQCALQMICIIFTCSTISKWMRIIVIHSEIWKTVELEGRNKEQTVKIILFFCDYITFCILWIS
jgi:hypothetical protein